MNIDNNIKNNDIIIIIIIIIIRKADIDIVKTNRWLQSDGLKTEIEGLIKAAKNKRLPTRNYQTIIKMGHIEYVDCVNKKLNLATSHQVSDYL